jgi:hypothetical protein
MQGYFFLMVLQANPVNKTVVLILWFWLLLINYFTEVFIRQIRLNLRKITPVSGQGSSLFW